MLVYLSGRAPAQATTGSLVVVGVTSLVGAVTAYRAGNVLLARGARLRPRGHRRRRRRRQGLGPRVRAVLLAAFAVLMLVVGGLMAVRQLTHAAAARARTATPRRADPALDDPIITFSPTFACQCPRALKVLVTATVVGLLTGFLGVGGGFLVVPALVLALALPMGYAAGTSLVVITLTSAAALAVRAGIGVAPDWGRSLVLTASPPSAASPAPGSPTAPTPAGSPTAFTVLVLGVAVYTAARPSPPSSEHRPSPHPT